MKRIRVIPRLDIKNNTVIKGIHLEGLRVVGDPQDLARRYYEAGADELLYMDAVASLYERNSLQGIVEAVSRDIFIPLIVGGGIRSLDDIRQLLRCGADKVAINTAAVKNPKFIADAARAFGSQCIVASIEAKKRTPDGWEAYTDGAREHTGLDVSAWIARLIELGAGEILVTSIDAEGTQKGFDLDLVRAVCDAIPVPLIVCGGAGSAQDFTTLVSQSRIDAVSAASVFHYGKMTVHEVKRAVRA